MALSTMTRTAEFGVIDERAELLRHRVSWGAVFAGVVAALVVQLLLNLLGIGIGASSLDAANVSDNPSASGFSMSAGIWWTVSGIVASLIGGIVAGRLAGSATPNTARWHGFVSWCATTLVLFYLLTSAVGGLLGGTLSALGGTLSAAGKGAASTVVGVAGVTNGDALAAQAKRLVSPNDAQSAQDDVLSYIRASIAGDQPAADAARSRAVDSVAKAANISADEARTKLQQAGEQAKQAADTAKQKAQQAAEATRKGVATAGLYGFVALVLGGIAAFVGGGIGAPRRVVG